MFTIDRNKSLVNFTGSDVLRLQKPNHASHLHSRRELISARSLSQLITLTTGQSLQHELHQATVHTLLNTPHDSSAKIKTARVVCANVPYFLDALRASRRKHSVSRSEFVTAVLKIQVLWVTTSCTLTDYPKEARQPVSLRRRYYLPIHTASYPTPPSVQGPTSHGSCLLYHTKPTEHG